MWSRLGRAILAGVVLVLLLLAASAARVIARTTASLHPERTHPAAPAGSEAVLLRTADGHALRGAFVPPRGQPAVIVLVHGHGGDRTQLWPLGERLSHHGFGVLAYDARAHGDSEGQRIGWGDDEQQDVSAAIDYASAHGGEGAIGAIGFSLGGTALAEVAARDSRIRGAALLGTPPSLEEEIRWDERRLGAWSAFWALRTLGARGIDPARVRPIDRICAMAPRPLLIVQGTADEDIPPDSATRLAAAACGPVRQLTLPGVTHRQYSSSGELAAALLQFFGQLP